MKLSLENCYHLFSKYYWIRVTIPVISLETKGFSFVRLSIQVMMRLKDILDGIKQFRRLTTFCFVCFCGWRVLIYRGFLFFGKIIIYATSFKRKLVSGHGSHSDSHIRPTLNYRKKERNEESYEGRKNRKRERNEQELAPGEPQCLCQSLKEWYVHFSHPLPLP